MPKQNVSGIYAIVNTVNGKQYIGSSKSIYYRWSQNHLPTLRQGNHHNRHLQAAWNKYGEQSFEMRIIEECDQNTLFEREGFWIEKNKSWEREHGYNLTRIVDEKQVFSNETVERRSAARTIEDYWTSGVNKQILERFQQGTSKNAIAKELGITRSAVYSCLEHSRMHKNTGKGAVVKLTSEAKKQVKKLRDKGMSWGEISDETGVSKTQLYRTETAGMDGKYRGGRAKRSTYRTVTPEVIEKVEQLRGKGKKWEDIERTLGVSRFALYLNGITETFKPVSRKVPKNKMNEETKSKIMQLLSEGMGVVEISRLTGVAKSTIRYQRKHHVNSR